MGKLLQTREAGGISRERPPPQLGLSLGRILGNPLWHLSRPAGCAHVDLLDEANKVVRRFWHGCSRPIMRKVLGPVRWSSLIMASHDLYAAQIVRQACLNGMTTQRKTPATPTSHSRRIASRGFDPLAPSRDPLARCRGPHQTLTEARCPLGVRETSLNGGPCGPPDSEAHAAIEFPLDRVHLAPVGCSGMDGDCEAMVNRVSPPYSVITHEGSILEMWGSPRQSPGFWPRKWLSSVSA